MVNINLLLCNVIATKHRIIINDDYSIRKKAYACKSTSFFTTYVEVTNRDIKKASHTFVVYHLLIDIVQFVWSYVRAGMQVVQFSK